MVNQRDAVALSQYFIMKQRFYFLTLFSIFYFGSIAQQNRFVYIQSENKLPFYIKNKNAILNSSAAGYIIIPKLKDGTFQFNIGFPKNEWPLQAVSLAINNKDAGYTLKNFNEKGWGLVNLQTMETIMAKGAQVGVINNNVENDDDLFTQVLSDVVNTPDLKKKSTQISPEILVKKIEEPIVVIAKEPAIKVVKEPVVVKVEEVIAKEKEPVGVKREEMSARIKQLLNTKNSKGRQMVYLDESGNDTINVFIPVINLKAPASVTQKTKKSPGKIKEKFIDIELQNPNAKDTIVKTAITPANKEEVKKNTSSTLTMINSDCKANASDDDFLKLRKKMAAAGSNDKMVTVAKKAFKVKCFSTDHIKNLSVLFLDDAGRYQFFDAAYPFVYDSGNFSTLQQQLTDPYFITRFQAMIRR